MSDVHADIKPPDGALAPVERESGVATRLHALPDEAPRIGSFATGLASDEPRPWSGIQLVETRQSGIVSGALPDDPPRHGSFATGLAKDEPRPWSGMQLVGDRQRRRQ